MGRRRPFATTIARLRRGRHTKPSSLFDPLFGDGSALADFAMRAFSSAKRTATDTARPTPAQPKP